MVSVTVDPSERHMQSVYRICLDCYAKLIELMATRAKVDLKTLPVVVYMPTSTLHAAYAAGGPADGSLYNFYTLCNRERDALRAENERLTEEVALWRRTTESARQDTVEALAENEQLRAALASGAQG